MLSGRLSLSAMELFPIHFSLRKLTDFPSPSSQLELACSSWRLSRIPGQIDEDGTTVLAQKFCYEVICPSWLFCFEILVELDSINFFEPSYVQTSFSIRKTYLFNATVTALDDPPTKKSDGKLTLLNPHNLSDWGSPLPRHLSTFDFFPSFFSDSLPLDISL